MWQYIGLNGPSSQTQVHYRENDRLTPLFSGSGSTCLHRNPSRYDRNLIVGGKKASVMDNSCHPLSRLFLWGSKGGVREGGREQGRGREREGGSKGGGERGREGAREGEREGGREGER